MSDSVKCPLYGFEDCDQCHGSGYLMTDEKPVRMRRCVACVERCDYTDLTTSELDKRAVAAALNAEKLMEAHGQSPESLFSWSWEEFRKLYPEEYREIELMTHAGRRRGLYKKRS